MAGVAVLVDRAAVLPPGPDLAAVLHQLSQAAVPNARRVEVMQARSRQLAHEQASLYAQIVEISHTVALTDLDGERDETGSQAATRFEWAAHEIAGALTWTPTAAHRELGFATALVERLPLVQEAFLRGRIDRAKAHVFVDYLDPDTGDVTAGQACRLCEKFVPEAPRLTTKQLSDRLLRAVQAINPRLRRRQYERAVQSRGVALYLDPRTGTATLVGNGLPPDEAAAAAARLDRLVEAAKRAGHPGTRPQISADLYLAMLGGSVHGFTEAPIIDWLLTRHRPDGGRHPDERHARGSGTTNATTGDAAAATIADTAAAETAAETAADVDAAGAGSSGSGAGADRGAVREGIEIRVGLATVAGLDERPGEIPGLGPVDAGAARTAVAAQQRGAAWKFAIVDTDGYLLLAGPLRRRPHTGTGLPGVRGGIVEIHITVEELNRYASDPDLDPGLAQWAGVLAEMAAAWADRDQLRARLAAHPRARFARGALADHVRIRDRNCVGPGCTRPARRSDLDHTRDHGRGGQTVEANIGPACRRHHPDKDRGWGLTQPEPGVFVWVSPLGRTYRTRGEPVRPDIPDPDPAPENGQQEESAAEYDGRLRRYEDRILRRPAAESPRPPPPPGPAPRPDDGPPPF
jgi:hypothetical protein